MIQDIFTNISILIAFLLVVGQVFMRSSLDPKRNPKIQVSLGISFGILGVVLLFFTIHMSHNVIIDLRNISIICAGIIGGPLAAMLSAVIISLSRILLFNASTASATGAVAALVIGAGTAYICSRKMMRYAKYSLAFILSMLISNAALAFLISDKLLLLWTLAYYWPTYIVGAVLAYFTCDYIIYAGVNYRLMSYYSMTADNLMDMISTHKPDGKAKFATPSIEQLFGYTAEEFIGTSVYGYIHTDDIKVIKEVASISKEKGNNYTLTFRVKCKDGKYIWVETSVKNILDDEGSVKEWICVTRDITKRKKIEQELRVSNARLTAIFENAGTGIVLRDCDGNLIDANQAYLDMLGYTKSEVEQLSDIIHPDDIKLVENVVSDLVSGKYNSHWSEVRYIDKNGQTAYTDVTTAYVPGTENMAPSVIRVVNNITERKMKEEELMKAKSHADRIAATDFLTGVLSRRAFYERLEEEFARAVREKSQTCIIIADIDHFKKINDMHGHHIGDLVLQNFTKCLSDACRPYDFIGRQGGEEFIICLPDTAAEQGARVAERMKSAVGNLEISHGYLEKPIKITASFGVVSSIPKEGDSTDFLIMQADNTMYKAKEEGRNRVCAAYGN